jgi:RHS repeat-associated protein
MTSHHNPFHTDALGSVVAISNGSGAVTYKAQYDPWGEILAQEGMTNPDYTFVGAYGVRRMAAPNGTQVTTKYTMGVRHYDAYAGRFLQEDPIGLQGGDVNFYRYSNNNPVKYIDPSGHTSRDACSKKCTGRARILGGNSNTIGRPGGFSGDTVGDILVEAGTAAIDTAQWGGKGVIRPIRNSIYGELARGGGLFHGISDVIGSDEVANVRQELKDRYPGTLLLELISGSDMGVQDVAIFVPLTLSCPQNTVERK